jgi:hypothetical protein
MGKWQCRLKNENYSTAMEINKLYQKSAQPPENEVSQEKDESILA